MRQFLGLVALLSILGGALPMSAQQTGVPATGSPNAFTPRNINFQPVNPNQMIANQNLTNSFHTPAKQQAFSLANVFHSMPQLGWPITRATAPVLPASQNFVQPTQYPRLNIFPTTAQYPTTNNPYIIHKQSSN